MFEALELFYQAFTGFSLMLPRIIAIFAMIPVFGAGILPGSARLGFAVSMGLVLAPLGFDAVDLETTTAFFLLTILGKEVLIGILMGFLLSSIFYAVESMGFFIDNQRGSTMASSIDPLTGSQTSPLGIFMTQVVAVYFLISGAFLVMLFAIYQSYQVLPVTEFFPTFRLEDTTLFLGVVDYIMMLAVLLAAPALIAMFLSEFALGLVSRFAPQLNVFFLAMPVKSAVGILMLILYLVLLPDLWEDEFTEIAARISILSALLQ